ncbi:hypothetical protein ACHWQZ_G006042 [Mnemiopsis leidyi]
MSSIERKILWKRKIEGKCNLQLFRDIVNRKYGLALRNYPELYQWSIDNYDLFWEQVFHFGGIKCSKLYDEVVDKSVKMIHVPEWFRGCRLNFAENLLKFRDNKTALICTGEAKRPHRVTYAELYKKTAVLAEAFKRAGVQKGDCIAGYLPNDELAVEAMLAASSIGAIWSSTSPDFGVTGVVGRFSQVNPKILFAVDAVMYNGKRHDQLEKLKKIVNALPNCNYVVVQPNLSEKVDLSEIPRSCLLSDFLSGCDVDNLTFEQLPFNHPMYLMFSSGTTGPPKCMVHSAGGTLIQHLKELVLQSDLSRDDVLFYYTTTGWMMWNWLVSGLAAGSSIVLYDGSPFLPTVTNLWDLTDQCKISIFGTSPKWLQACEEKAMCPRSTHDLTSLRAVLSTGAPLAPHQYDYVYNNIKLDLQLSSITGGTDIISCFAGSIAEMPVYRGQLQYRNLGMAVFAYDHNGKELYDSDGELVCTKPFPSMPIYFGNDPDGAKYRKAYFDKYDGVWSHGDFVTLDSVTGGLVMNGRSDGTLNPGGVRFGSAEIYNVMDSFPTIADSLCVGQKIKDDERVVLFLKMAEGKKLTEELIKEVKLSIRSRLSARHVPSVIMEIADIPYTINGKKVEVAIKKIVSGEKVGASGALRNPEALDLYRDIPQLKV